MELKKVDLQTVSRLILSEYVSCFVREHLLLDESVLQELPPNPLGSTLYEHVFGVMYSWSHSRGPDSTRRKVRKLQTILISAFRKEIIDDMTVSMLSKEELDGDLTTQHISKLARQFTRDSWNDFQYFAHFSEEGPFCYHTFVEQTVPLDSSHLLDLLTSWLLKWGPHATTEQLCELLHDAAANGFIDNQALESIDKDTIDDTHLAARLSQMQLALEEQHEAASSETSPCLVMISKNYQYCTYDSVTKTWKVSEGLSKWEDGGTATSHQTQLISAGAWGKPESKDVTVCDLRANTVVKYPRLPVGLERPGVVVVQDYVYVFGGKGMYDCDWGEKGIYRMHMKKPRGWVTLAHMVYGVQAPCVGQKNELIFAFGGWNCHWNNNEEKYTQIFNTKTNSWKTGTPCPKELNWDSAACVPYLNKMLIFTRTGCISYDDITDDWTDEMTFGQKFLEWGTTIAAVFHNNNIYVCSYTDDDMSVSVFQYAPEHPDVLVGVAIDVSDILRPTELYSVDI